MHLDGCEVRLVASEDPLAAPSVALVLMLGNALDDNPLGSSDAGSPSEIGPVTVTVTLPRGENAGSFASSVSLAEIPSLVQGVLEEITSTLRSRALPSPSPSSSASSTGPAPSAGRDLESTARLERLTTKERQVLRCLAEGMTAQQLSGLLNISVSTARSHIQSIFHKLGVTSQLGAVVLAHNAGWFNQE